jgi:hypothetical protein
MALAPSSTSSGTLHAANRSKLPSESFIVTIFPATCMRFGQPSTSRASTGTQSLGLLSRTGRVRTFEADSPADVMPGATPTGPAPELMVAQE